MSAPSAAGTLTPPVSATDHAQGPETSPATLVEYSDYECPFCGLAFPILKALQKQMKEELRFVHRNFPLKEAHPHSVRAALAAEAVGMHGEAMFWRMHDTLYTHQDALEHSDLVAYAKELGTPAREIVAAFEGGPAADRVRADFRSGVRSGVNGTPTFFINGERYDDDWRDIPTFLAALRAAAARAV